MCPACAMPYPFFCFCDTDPLNRAIIAKHDRGNHKECVNIPGVSCFGK